MEGENLLYCNFVVYKGKQWLWSTNYNALFSRDVKCGRIKRTGGYLKCNGGAYTHTVLYQGKLVMIPGISRKIMIFDIENNAFRFVDVEIKEEKECNLFYGYAASEEYLFMIGNQIPYLLKFNMKTEKVEKIINLFPKGKNRKVYFRDIVLDENKLIIPAVEDDLLFEVDVDTLQWTNRKMGHSKNGFSSICKGGDSIWIMPRDKGPLLQWNRKNDSVIKHEIEEAGYQYVSFKPSFQSGVYLENKLWIFPFFSNLTFSFNLETGEISSDNAVNEYFEFLKRTDSLIGEYKFRAVQEVDGNIYLLCCVSKAGEMLIYNPKENSLKKCERENKISRADYLEYIYGSNIPIIKEGELSLEDFIYFVERHSMGISDKKEHGVGIYGHQIYKVIGNK